MSPLPPPIAGAENFVNLDLNEIPGPPALDPPSQVQPTLQDFFALLSKERNLESPRQCTPPLPSDGEELPIELDDGEIFPFEAGVQPSDNSLTSYFKGSASRLPQL